jgi:hypothetical protein
MNCKICGRNLKNPKAIAKGMGAVCERKQKGKEDKNEKEVCGKAQETDGQAGQIND